MELTLESMRYLARADVIACCAEFDLVDVVRSALVRHAEGDTILPEEAYLGWTAPGGGAARSLAMPGGIMCPESGLTLGLKVINGNVANPARGLPRAEGVILLFDPEVGWPTVIMEAAYVSAMRTAAVTAVAALALGVPGLRTVGVIGCGALARAHLELLPRAIPSIDEVTLYDSDPDRAAALAGFGRVVDSPRECAAHAELLVTTTTATEGYIRYDWLRPGTLVAHVSLSDLLPEVVTRADLVIVDDWELVSHDRRRLLGLMYGAGDLLPPGASGDVRAVDGTLGDVLTGRHPGRARVQDIVVSNPFGMSILDIAVAREVLAIAVKHGLGVQLPR